MELIRVFPFFGPNRHSDRTVVEYTIRFDPRDLEFLSTQGHKIEESVRRMLAGCGLLAPGQLLPGCERYDDPASRFSALSAALAILFQAKSGHRVSWFDIPAAKDESSRLCLVEHEDSDTGRNAVNLAWNVLSRKVRDLGPAFEQFRKTARSLVLPVDTEAIIRAADSRDIPWLKLNRQPFKELTMAPQNAGAQVQPNGLLQLGFGRFQVTLDGTFRRDTPAPVIEWVNDPVKRADWLKANGIPVADPRPTAGQRVFDLVMANGKPVSILVRQNQSQPRSGFDGQAHPETVALAQTIGDGLGAPVFVVSILAADLSRPLESAGEGVIDVDPGPVLSALFPAGSPMIHTIAVEMLESLFPGATPARVPIVATTGTNGKTTTTRMVGHIMAAAGLETGMICSHGVFINGENVWKGDANTQVGHARVLSNRTIEAAALEAHHAGLQRRGFAFRWCDVGICLNVSHDHIKQGDIDSVEAMALIKRSLPERARKAAVLFADDEHCMDMTGHMNADKVCLVSLQKDARSLAAHSNAQCVLEELAGDPWVVLYDGEDRTEIIRVDDIPAAQSGMAHHNLSNAMHAMAACRFIGIEADVIREAMQSFTTAFETTPGRMNIHDNGRFRVILDFAHNEDGTRHLCSFIDKLEVRGRRIAHFPMRGNRSDEEIRLVAGETAGHFDLYLLREYRNMRGRERGSVTAMMKEVLLDSGVSEEQIKVFHDPEESLAYALSLLEDGDLLWVKPSEKEIDDWWPRIARL